MALVLKNIYYYYNYAFNEYAGEMKNYYGSNIDRIMWNYAELWLKLNMLWDLMKVIFILKLSDNLK